MCNAILSCSILEPADLKGNTSHTSYTFWQMFNSHIKHSIIEEKVLKNDLNNIKGAKIL